MEYFLNLDGEKSRLTGINSEGEFVFESKRSYIVFWTLPAGELFSLLMESDNNNLLWRDIELSFDEIRMLHKKLSGSLHYSY